MKEESETMDISKAKKFIEELNKLQKRYSISIASGYEEEIDYDYDEIPYASGGSSYLVLVDEDGYEISLDDLENEYFTCYYCGRKVEEERSFCNIICKTSYNNWKYSDSNKT